MEYKPLISIKNLIVLSFIIVISFALISILLSNQPLIRQYFSDIATPLIELMVIISLFYATIRSQGRFKIAWMLITASVVSYTLGDIYMGNFRAWISYQSISFHFRFFLPIILSSICIGIILPLTFFIQPQRKN